MEQACRVCARLVAHFAAVVHTATVHLPPHHTLRTPEHATTTTDTVRACYRTLFERRHAWPRGYKGRKGYQEGTSQWCIAAEIAAPTHLPYSPHGCPSSCERLTPSLVLACRTSCRCMLLLGSCFKQLPQVEYPARRPRDPRMPPPHPGTRMSVDVTSGAAAHLPRARCWATCSHSVPSCSSPGWVALPSCG